MKRMMIATTVADDTEVEDLVYAVPGEDQTVWQWADFWADVADGVVTPAQDKTESRPDTS